jgi:hypothetical protein
MLKNEIAKSRPKEETDAPVATQQDHVPAAVHQAERVRRGTLARVRSESDRRSAARASAPLVF